MLNPEDEMAGTLLVVRDLVKDYPAPDGRLLVLDGVSFSLPAGESLAVMGPSGSGKSTLLNVLGTLDSPTTGEVLLDGENVHALDARRAAELRNRRVGFVFQDHHLLPQCTAVENVLLPRLAFGKASAEAVTSARGLLETVGLSDREGRFPSELSRGERQRVAVARAMMNLPRLLLCDEPTGSLDAETGEAVAKLFLRLRDESGVAVVVATHDPAIAEMFGRVGVLRGGALRE